MPNSQIKDSVREAARTLFPAPKAFTSLEADTVTYWWYSSITKGTHKPVRLPNIGDALLELGNIRIDYPNRFVGYRAHELCTRLINL